MPVASTAYFEESTEQDSPKMLQPGYYSYSLTHFPEAGTPGETQYFDPTTDLLVLVEVMSGVISRREAKEGILNWQPIKNGQIQVPGLGRFRISIKSAWCSVVFPRNDWATKL